MSTGDWQRVSKGRPCPVCGKDHWCVYAGPDDAPQAVICPRTESSRRIGEAGWLHRLRPSATAWPPWERTIRAAVRMLDQSDNGAPALDKMVEKFRAAVRPEALRRLAISLGLSTESLGRLDIGWTTRYGGAWAFPMRSGDSGNITGIRLRLPNGRKLAVRGGHEGLFLPSGIDRGGRLLVCEGPTDTAALLDLGLPTVGRPSCTGGVKHLVELARHREPGEVVVVADGDGPGQRGAANLASVLSAYCPAVRLISPPPPFKDARAWKQAGATADDFQALIDAAPVRRLVVQVRKAGGHHG